MFKNICMVTLACLLFVGASSKDVMAEEWQGNFNILLGSRTMQDSDFANLNLDKLAVFGLDIDFKQKSWPISMFVGFSGAKSDDTIISGVAVNVKATEYDIGARKYFSNGAFRPYLGAGVGFSTGTISFSVVGLTLSQSFSATGVLLNGGFLYTSDSFNVGLDLRALTGANYNSATKADYSQIGLILGYRF